MSQVLVTPQEERLYLRELAKGRRRQHAHHSVLALLAIGDVLTVLAMSLAAFFLRFEIAALVSGDSSGSLALLGSYWVHIMSGTIVMGFLLYFNDMYSEEALARLRYTALRILTCMGCWAVFFIFLALFFKVEPVISRSYVFLAAGMNGLGLILWRFVFCRHFIGPNMLQSIRRRALVIGWNDRAENLYQRSLSSDISGAFFPFRIVGAVQASDKQTADGIPLELHRGNVSEQLERLLQTRKYDTVLMANADPPSKEMLEIQETCGREFVDFMIIPNFVRALTSCLHVESFAGTPLLTQRRRQLDKPSSIISKRIIDILGALVGLTLFSPVIAYFCWRVYRESPGPVFYRQTRLGKNGERFQIIKIRSMKLDAEKGTGAVWCKEKDDRRLKIGEFMRKTNIDELPQFWNVLKGEMSLVGPRPERPELIKGFKYQVAYYNLRHVVKPGITGWAQINGWRGDTCLQSRIAADMEYIENWSVWMDFYICLKTFGAMRNAY